MRKRRMLVSVLAVAIVITGASFVAPAEARAGEIIGDCEVLFDYPHGSHHEPGNVSADQRVKCKTPQRYLGVESYLYRSSANDGYRWRIAGPKRSGENVNYMNAVAAEPCQKAIYWSEANYLIVDNDGVRHERFDVKSQAVDNPCKLP